jgi:hypothetical protein
MTTALTVNGGINGLGERRALDVGVASPSERKVRFGVATMGQKTSGVGAIQT